MKNAHYFFLIILAIVYSGCASTKCKPVVFPHSEHGYEAEPFKLVGAYKLQKGYEIVEFYGLQIEIPKGWQHKTPFEKTLYLFSPGKVRSVIITYDHPRTFGPNGAKGMHLIGCDNFEIDDHQEIKTDKDFIADVFLFTADKFDDPEFKPTFWHYFILWAKVDKFTHAEKIVHYEGNNFEAFRCDSTRFKNVYSTVTLFHEKQEPNHTTIATTFKDDSFVNNFMDMINVLNR